MIILPKDLIDNEKLKKIWIIIAIVQNVTKLPMFLLIINFFLIENVDLFSVTI